VSTTPRIDSPVTRRRILLLTSGVYATLALAGFGWAAFRGRPWLFAHPRPWLALAGPWDVLASLAAGVALAALTLVATRVLVARSRFGRELHLAFRELLGGLDGVAIAALALASGVGEEVFFRGALQPSLGLLPTSLLFGLLHIGPDRRFWAWTPWALVMGLLLGVMYEATGSLLGCVVAHVAINYENLQFIRSHDPRAPSSSDPPTGPRLVSREERR
jgi:membrane protease YdiL (CAAX protease family)